MGGSVSQIQLKRPGRASPQGEGRTCSARLAGLLLNRAAARGIDLQKLCAAVRLEPAHLSDPDARVPVSTQNELWTRVMRELNDPGFPIRIAAESRCEDWGLMGFVIMTAQSGIECMRRAEHFFALLTDTTRWRTFDEAHQVQVRLERSCPRTLAVRAQVETSVASYYQSTRDCCGTDINALQVAFSHSAPDDTSVHRQFFGIEPTFDAGWDGLRLPASPTKRVPRFANAKMSEFLLGQAQSQLDNLTPEVALLAEVRAAIECELVAGEPAAATVAKRLGKSERSLRRELAAHRSSFRSLVEAVRSELAEKLLRRDDASITEIAFALGFSDSSAFTRAFRRWHGVSPRNYRVQQCA